MSNFFEDDYQSDIPKYEDTAGASIGRKTKQGAAMLEKFLNMGKKALLITVGGFALFITIMSSFYIVGGSEYAVERGPGGDLTGIIEPGIHLKVPFVSTVHHYDQFQTISYIDEPGDGIGTLKRIAFADTYMGYIGGTVRYQLSANPELLVEMHKAYLNEDNLLLAGLNPVTKQLLTYTANQITGENYMQGGQNEYQIRVEDQGNNGLYVTKREKILVKKNSSNVGLNNQNPTERAQRDSFIYITKRQKDDQGNFLRQELPTTQYGIRIVQVTIDDFKPERKLLDFINRKKDQIAKRQGLIEDQENERQSAITAELKGTRERVEARQQMLKEKDAAVIGAQKKVELEQKEAELQIVRKKKELEIAEANLGIQTANAKSTYQQAKAIEFKGLAEAKVKKAMYGAVRKDILQLETDKAIAQYKYAALPKIKITMPTTVMNSGNSEGGSLQELTNLHIIDKIK